MVITHKDLEDAWKTAKEYPEPDTLTNLTAEQVEFLRDLQRRFNETTEINNPNG